MNVADPVAPKITPERATEPGSRRSRLFSVSRSLQIMAAAVFLAILAVTYQQLAELRSTTLAETHRQMARLDMVLAEQTGRAIETIDFILRGTIERPQSDGTAPPLTAEALRRRIMGVRQLLAIDMVDPQGQVVVSTRAGSDLTLPPAGLALLARQAAEPNAGLLFSEPIRLSDGTWTVLVARRFDDSAWHFTGIGVAWLNLLYFEDFYKAVELTENGAIILHRRDGLVLARYPHAEALMGTSYADQPPFRDILSRAIAGTVEMDSPLDGSRRILAIRALRAFPLAVNVSVDEAGVLRQWRRQTWILAGAALVLALLTTGLLFQLARRSRDVEVLLRQAGTARDAAESANTRLVVQMDERARAEAALRQAQRVEAVGQLTGGVAHDFNNLLTVLLGNIELLQANPLSAPFAQRLNTMRSAADRGARLTAQLLAFARRQPLMPRAVDLGQTILDMQPLLHSAVGSQVTIIIALEPNTPPARVDPTQIELVVLNLAINARDAMPQGGTLTLAIRSETLASSDRPDAPPAGSYVCLRVSDTGSGMSPEIQARAFEPFFTTKGPGAGSGLGLSQVYGVARQSGGIARIESQPGKGTTVEVLLPRAADNEMAASPIQMSAAAFGQQAGHAHILVVDDNPDVRITTALLLRRMGYRVTEASAAGPALGILRDDSSIDLLLSDVIMPGTTGPELVEQARQLRPELPVLFFSGYADPATIAGAGPLTHLLRKPFRPGELATAIEVLLAARHDDDQSVCGQSASGS